LNFRFFGRGQNPYGFASCEARLERWIFLVPFVVGLVLVWPFARLRIRWGKKRRRGWNKPGEF
jgi:hypothetical protein